MLKLNNALLRCCKKGDQNALMQVYDAYCNAMFSVACRYLKNEEDAKDAMQDGFLKAFTKLDDYRPEATFGAWLKRIIINQCLDTLKKKQLAFSDVEVSELNVVSEDNWNFDNTITKPEIITAIGKLPEKYRIVVTLHLLEGYDHEEISQILEIPIKTSRTHLRRAKLKLQDFLKIKYNAARY